MSSKEIEAMAVGIREMTELEVAGASADAIKYFVGLLETKGVPVVTPPRGRAGRGGLHHLGNPRHGTRLRFHGSRPGRQRRARGHGVAPPGRAAARLHYVALPIRGGPPEVALRSSRPDRRPGVLRRAARAAILRRQDEAQGRLGRRAGRSVRRTFRAGVVTRPARDSDNYCEALIRAGENGGETPDRYIPSSAAGDSWPPGAIEYMPAQDAAALPAGTLYPCEQGFPSPVPRESWILTLWILTGRRNRRGLRRVHAMAHRGEKDLTLSFPCPEHFIARFDEGHAAHRTCVNVPRVNPRDGERPPRVH